MQVSKTVKLTFHWGKNCPQGKEIGGTKKKGSTSFSSALRTRKTFRVHLHVVVIHISCLIVKTAAGCYSCGQALALNTIITTCLCAMFRQRKSSCSKSFKSESFTISVTQAVNHGKNVDDCSCASKWEWVSVNSRQTGLVTDMKSQSDAQNCLYVYI